MADSDVEKVAKAAITQTMRTGGDPVITGVATKAAEDLARSGTLPSDMATKALETVTGLDKTAAPGAPRGVAAEKPKGPTLLSDLLRNRQSKGLK